MPDKKTVARQIFQQTLDSISIPRVVQSKLQFDRSELVLPESSLDLSRIDTFRVIAIGKAAHAMVDGLAAILPPAIRLTESSLRPPDPRSRSLDSSISFPVIRYRISRAGDPGKQFSACCVPLMSEPWSFSCYPAEDRHLSNVPSIPG